MSITGDWRLALETPLGRQTPTLTLIEDDGKLSGAFKGTLGSAEFENGTIDGHHLNWDVTFEVMGQKVTFQCAASVYGSNINGRMVSDMGGYCFTGKNIDDDPEDTGVVSGYQRAMYNLESELKLLKRHTSALVKAESYIDKKGLKLNVGCGSNTKEHWLNIDMHSEADLQLDVREPMPFSDGSAEIIYSEHFFEHLDFPDDACNFLSESYRVLQAGGEFSVGVPDTEWPLKSYIEGKNDYFEHARESGHPEWCNTPMHKINFHFRQCGDHKYAYDFETLASVLNEAGFVGIEERPFDPELDMASRKRGTLYVRAYKPE